MKHSLGNIFCIYISTKLCNQFCFYFANKNLFGVFLNKIYSVIKLQIFFFWWGCNCFLGFFVFFFFCFVLFLGFLGFFFFFLDSTCHYHSLVSSTHLAVADGQNMFPQFLQTFQEWNISHGIIFFLRLHICSSWHFSHRFFFFFFFFFFVVFSVVFLDKNRKKGTREKHYSSSDYKIWSMEVIHTHTHTHTLTLSLSLVVEVDG